MLIIKSQSESPIYHFVTQMFELCLSHLLVEYPFPDPDCGSQILFSLLSIMTWRSNAKSKCVSRSAALVSTDSIRDCKRGCSRYSRPARYALQTSRKNGQYENLRTSNIPQASIMSCKLVCNKELL